MPGPDVSKMKVADLKRELRLRGLSTTGNKNELQERLQSALIAGELCIDDTAISGEDLLEGEDAVLTDEEEAKILGADENELLKSPTTTPVTVPELDSSGNKDSTDELNQTPLSIPKKVVLKRKSSFTTVSSNSNLESGVDASAVEPVAAIAKENAEPPAAKEPKTISYSQPVVTDPTEGKQNAVTKISQLSMQERLEMRAKKFGINTNVVVEKGGRPVVGKSKEIMSAQQIEMLKKRAERFGCVVSSKMAKIDAEEKLEKRKQRFGGVSVTDAENTKSSSNDVWAEKARLRLDRFKTSPTSAATVVTNVQK